MGLRRVAALVALSSALTCSARCGDPSPPPTPSPSPGAGEPITGRERLGWTQRAQDAAELATFDYAIYVDGARQVLAGETCSADAAAFACSAPLPPLTAGSHSIALAAFIAIDGGILESPRSAPLQVTVAAAVSAAAAEAVAAETALAVDGVRVRTAIVARGLEDPIDLALTPDGRVFVAERRGTITVVSPLGPPERVSGLPPGDADSLESVAIHPEFARTRFVFGVYRTPASFLVVRLRYAGGTFGEAAVVREIRTATAQAGAVARFGPDGKLYLAIGAGTDPRAPQDPASALGKILRLDEDGSTPRDNPGGSPMFSSGHRDPRGLVWDPRTLTMWAVEADDAGDELNAIAAGRNYGWPLARGGGSYPGATPAVFTWEPGTHVTGASIVPPSAAEPFGDTLLVAARGAQDLFRVVIDSRGRVIANDRMLDGRFGRIGQVAAGADTIYLTTANRDLWGPGQDLLVSLSRER